jgi:hypothetical protein
LYIVAEQKKLFPKKWKKCPGSEKIIKPAISRFSRMFPSHKNPLQSPLEKVEDAVC